MTTLDPIQVFRTEAAELFEQIEGGLLDLLHDLTDQDQIDAVFRGLHTLKGSGAMFGFEALAAFTHHCETAFDRVRKGEVPATSELVAAVLEAQDHMQALVDNPHGVQGDVGEQTARQASCGSRHSWRWRCPDTCSGAESRQEAGKGKSCHLGNPVPVARQCDGKRNQSAWSS